MYLRMSEKTDKLRQELRRYFDLLLTDEVRAELRAEGAAGGPTRSRVLRQMGSDGWLGIGWPTGFGGQGKGSDAQYVLFDEAYRAGAPLPMVTLTTVAPTLMAKGSEDQKEYFLPRILRGELIFAIGYTEPAAGTDLASLRTRAVRDGDEYVINGNKVFTSGADGADWIWLAARTDPEAPKHKGISLILVPTSSNGFSATPIHTVGGGTTTATYYDNVRVPVTNVVGQENRGWEMITTQLNHERIGLAALSGTCEGMLEDTIEWARCAKSPDERAVIELPWVATKLAEAYARVRAMQLLNWQLVDATGDRSALPGDASAAKVFATETAVDVYRMLLEVRGSTAMRITEQPWRSDSGRLALLNLSSQINTFGGGVAEIQREIVAWNRLGMARRTR